MRSNPKIVSFGTAGFVANTAKLSREQMREAVESVSCSALSNCALEDEDALRSTVEIAAVDWCNENRVPVKHAAAIERATLEELALEKPVKPNKGRSMPKVEASFNRHFDTLVRVFPDFGTVELCVDELAGNDNGAGSERQFGYCADERPLVVAFAPKTEQLPTQYIDGLMAHELGHACEFRYGVPKLEKRWGKLPASIERRADKIASHVFKRPIEYGELDIQCVGCGGKKMRPRRLG